MRDEERLWPRWTPQEWQSIGTGAGSPHIAPDQQGAAGQPDASHGNPQGTQGYDIFGLPLAPPDQAPPTPPQAADSQDNQGNSATNDNPFGAAPQQPLSFGTLREHFRATRDQEAAQPFAHSSPEEAPAPDTPPAPPSRFGARAPGSAWLLDSVPPPVSNDDWLLEAPTVPHASAAPSYMASEPGEPFDAHPRQDGYADAG